MNQFNINRNLVFAFLALCFLEAAALALTWPRASRISQADVAPMGAATIIQLKAGERMIIKTNQPGFDAIIWEDSAGVPHTSAVMKWGPQQFDSISCSPDIGNRMMAGGRISGRSGVVVGYRNWDDNGIPTIKFSVSPAGLTQRFFRKTLDWSEDQQPKQSATKS